MQLIEKLKGSGVARLSQPYSFRLSHRFGGLPGSRRIRSAWSVSGQRSNCGASTGWDAPNTSWSCPGVRPLESNRHPRDSLRSVHGVQAPSGERVSLLSRESVHSSMPGRNEIAAGFGLIVDGFLKIAQLRRRQDDQERLKQHDGFAETGIKVVVAGVDFMPAALRICVETHGEIVSDAAKVAVQIFHHLFHGADFMQELQPMGKEHAVEQPAHAR